MPAATTSARAARVAAVLLVLAALTLTACGAAAQPQALTFVRERQAGALRTQYAIDEAQAALAGLSSPPSAEQLRHLGRIARIARERVNEVRVGLPTYEAAEEEVPIAEDEAGTGANELNLAMGELVAYARRPRPQTLALYRTYMKHGVAKWNEAVTQLWRLAKRSPPPRLQ